ncbi:hypothetical protein MSAN_02345900 [Mycena sanguinolenta]|uniref:Uncharacterized protein n=1 Tax=Mycena sanguinolenta TaxID=230812 RepID=A0A8H7CGC5_9AGAR|nr:hypothetical protein MSAN_02345900 [Mycena sanguinolenta]
MSLVANTLESLEFFDIFNTHTGPIFRFLRRHLHNIRTLTFRDVHGPLPLHSLVYFLYAHSAQLRTFRLVWTSSPFLDDTIGVTAGALETFDTIGGHLTRLAQTGMDIYLGTHVKNYVPVR